MYGGGREGDVMEKYEVAYHTSDVCIPLILSIQSLDFLQIAQARGQTWDLFVFIYFLSLKAVD